MKEGCQWHVVCGSLLEMGIAKALWEMDPCKLDKVEGIVEGE
ncbi:MAG: hypothetical protein ACFFCW_01330 [Candidatus Hodarchaeota archaeon]